jgi:hypothetical protein
MNVRGRAIGRYGLLALAALWVPWMAPVPASAADIVVSSATPSTAEQGTIALLVTVKGSGFPKSPQVRFCRTDTGSAACDSAGITVKSTKGKGATTIETVIDVALDAATTGFDIEVIEPLSGRKGRGTNLFAVKQKPNDTTPPAEPITSISADAIGTAVTVSWIVPDGTQTYDIRFATTPINSAADLQNPNVLVPEGSLGRRIRAAVGRRDYFTVRNLTPGTTYWFAVNTLNSIGSSSPAFAFTSATTPYTSWSIRTLDAPGCCQSTGAGFDASGLPTASWVAASANYARVRADNAVEVELISPPGIGG